MTQDTHQEAMEEFDDARESVQQQYDKMRIDLRFSDPTDAQQWDTMALDLRKGRPCLTFDRTNPFIAQVVNAARQNKPSIHCLPANSEAAIEVAEQLNGIVRHIEYISHAGIAYDTAIEYAARIGLGWMRVVPEIVRPETNEQEIRIKRIADPLSCYLGAGWSEPDGSDAMVGFIETMMSLKAFKKEWPKAETESWERGSVGWFSDKELRICERFKINEKKENRLTIELEGQSMVMSEDEYWQMRQQTGMAIPATSFEAKIRTVKWSKMSGCEVLEETDFPSQYLPLIPVIGHELMVDGKRHLCGMTRRLMDSQRAYNYERSAFIESVSMQPKAPLMVPVDAMEGLEGAYGSLNQGNPAVLPYNHVGEDGVTPIPAPTRLMPPVFPAAFAQGGQIATTDMEAAVGMFRANLGAPGTAISGRAKREDKVSGDTANFHYGDNRDRSVEQLGRVIVDMYFRVADTKRTARTIGADGKHGFVEIDPDMKESHQKRGKKVVSINPNIGAYDVYVKAGPAYTTLREEQAEQLANIMQSAPTLTPILADLWIGSQDWPEAEKAQKRLEAMLPPQIQQMEQDDGEEIPPALQAQMQQKDQQIAQLSHALETAHSEHMQLEGEVKAKIGVETMKAQAAGQQAEADRQHQMRLEQIKAQTSQNSNENAWRIAELNGKIELAKLGTNAQMAAQALEADQVIEGQKLAVQDQKTAASIHMHESSLQATAAAQGKQHAMDAHMQGEQLKAAKNKPTDAA